VKQKPLLKKQMSDLEASFQNAWNMLAKDMPKPVVECEFFEGRGWRFDFCWPEAKLAVEMDGGLRNNTFFSKKHNAFITTKGGRHNRPEGYIEDCNKMNAATESGWAVLRYTSDHMKHSPVQVIEQVMNTLKSRMSIGNLEILPESDAS
jgi:very-short-patch-repair endonuclease